MNGVTGFEIYRSILALISTEQLFLDSLKDYESLSFN